mgnify:CR=1 FL=1
MKRVIAVMILGLAGCATAGANRPATDGVRALVEALRANDPKRAYGLLSDDARRRLSYDAFAAEWAASEKERAWQVVALEEGLRGSPNAGERATVDAGGKSQLNLVRQDSAWKLETPLIAQAAATRPRDLVRMLAAAVQRRDLGAILNLLSGRRRDGMSEQLDGFLAGLSAHMNASIEMFGDDRAEMVWDHGGLRYRLVMRVEDGSWRLDDLHIQRTPRNDDDAAPAASE